MRASNSQARGARTLGREVAAPAVRVGLALHLHPQRVAAQNRQRRDVIHAAEARLHLGTPTPAGRAAPRLAVVAAAAGRAERRSGALRRD